MTKLTPELQESFLHLLELGVPIKYACEALNIDERTYFVWMKLGRHKTEGKYFQFFQSVQTIPGKAMAQKLAHIEKAAEKGNVTAAIWFLEHKYPDLFGNKLQMQIEHSGNINQQIQFTVIDKIVKDEDAEPATKPADTVKADPGDKNPTKTKPEQKPDPP